jgi:hypothetical protein
MHSTGASVGRRTDLDGGEKDIPTLIGNATPVVKTVASLSTE